MTSAITNQIIDEDDDVSILSLSLSLSTCLIVSHFLSLSLLFRVLIGKQPLEKSMWLAKPRSPALRTNFPILPLPFQIFIVLRPRKGQGLLGNLRSINLSPRQAHQGLVRRGRIKIMLRVMKGTDTLTLMPTQPKLGYTQVL